MFFSHRSVESLLFAIFCYLLLIFRALSKSKLVFHSAAHMAPSKRQAARAARLAVAARNKAQWDADNATRDPRLGTRAGCSSCRYSLGGCRHCRKKYARNLARYLAATPTAFFGSTAPPPTPAASTTPVSGSTAAKTTPAASTTPVSGSTAAETTPAASTTPVAGSTAAPPTMPLALVEIKKEVVETAPVPAPLKVGFQLILLLKNQELIFNY